MMQELRKIEEEDFELSSSANSFVEEFAGRCNKQTQRVNNVFRFENMNKSIFRK